MDVAHQAPLLPDRVGSLPGALRLRTPSCRNHRSLRQGLQQPLQRPRRSCRDRPGPRIRGDQLDPGAGPGGKGLGPPLEPLELGDHPLGRRSLDPAGRRHRLAALSGGRRTLHPRGLGVLDHQGAGQHQAPDLGVSELGQQGPDIAVDRFLPDPLPSGKIAAHQAGIDSRVRRRGIERDQASLAVAGHANPGSRRACRLQPVHQGQDLLNFVSDRVAPHGIGHAVEPLPVRHVGHGRPAGLKSRVAREPAAAVDKRGHNHLAAGFRQAKGKSGLGPNSRLQSHQLLRGDVGIRQGDHLGDGRPVPGSDQQALGPQARHNVPADPPDGHGIAFRQGRPSLRREELQPRRGPSVNHSDDLAEPLPVGLDRPGVVRPGGEISLPESRSFLRRRFQATHQETVDPGHHAS